MCHITGGPSACWLWLNCGDVLRCAGALCWDLIPQALQKVTAACGLLSCVVDTHYGQGNTAGPHPALRAACSTAGVQGLHEPANTPCLCADQTALRPRCHTLPAHTAHHH